MVAFWTPLVAIRAIVGAVRLVGVPPTMEIEGASRTRRADWMDRPTQTGYLIGSASMSTGLSRSPGRSGWPPGIMAPMTFPWS